MSTVFLDGQFVDQNDARVSAFDAAVQHGVGVFDTMVGGVRGDGSTWVLQVEEHLERLAGSARELGLSESIRAAGLVDAVLETVRRSGLAAGSRARVRITVTGGDLNLLTRGAGASG